MKRWNQSKNNAQVWMWLVMEEQYCIGAWNIRSMNQDILEVVRHEMVRMDINIFRTSELKWMAMGEFNSDDYYIYYCGLESFRRNEIALIVNQRDQDEVLGCNLKNDKMISLYFQSKPFNITVILAYAQPLMLKKLKLNGSMKTYETF